MVSKMQVEESKWIIETHQQMIRNSFDGCQTGSSRKTPSSFIRWFSDAKWVKLQGVAKSSPLKFFWCFLSNHSEF